MDVKKCLVIYHKDLDGQCSAAVAGRMLSNYYKMYYVGAQYDEIIDLPEGWKDFHKLCILDFSLNEKWMSTVVKVFNRNIVWIDHHKSSTNLYEKYETIPGFRVIGTAACELTWRYFFDMTKMPIFIKWIGDRDLWKYNYGNDTRYFCEYISYKETKPENDIWKILFDKKDFKPLIDKGRLLYKAKVFRLRQVVENNAYESSLDGHKCMKINFSDGQAISDLSHIILNEYDFDVSWVFFYKKIGNYIFRINSIRSNGDIDVSEIAGKRPGGGGHKNAAGWSEKMHMYTS